ncbi:MAG TPA: type II toxin-antitoxin system HicB family antitoxin [Spirochaetota bacterium]|nr:type II toxin-antitoxin system HicB family antitoxin [Spirochaetota bacterium]
MIAYPAHILFSKEDNCYTVEFPDLPGCLTFGDDLQAAINNASEALSGYLESIDLRRISIPSPSKHSGKDIYLIHPDRQVAFAVWLKLKRAEKGLSQKKAAELMGIHFQSYQKFENPKTANPTLKTIERIEKVMGEALLTI